MLRKIVLVAALCVSNLSVGSADQTATVQAVSPENTAVTVSQPTRESIRIDKEFCQQILVDNASDINSLSPSGKTSLQLLTFYFINNFRTERLIGHALNRGANPNVQDDSGKTPLFFIVAYVVCPEIFAAKQAEVDAQKADNPTEETRTMEAPETDTAKAEKMEAQPEKTAPVRAPLHDRALGMAVIEMLLAFSADPTLADKEGVSPLLLALSVGDEQVLELFARYGLLQRVFKEQEAQGQEVEIEITLP